MMATAENHQPILEFLTTEADIDAVIGKPGPRVKAKVVSVLDAICRDFIARSPFVVIASSNTAGQVDVSPKGDPAGFVHVLDDYTLAIPERPGNLRSDTFRNVVQNPKVGLIFVVPGNGETLRVSGTARIAHVAWLRERMAMSGRIPAVVLVVTVEEAFVHCSKCMVRSRIWQPDSWTSGGLASIGEAMVVQGKLAMPVAEMVAIAENDVRNRLY